MSSQHDATDTKGHAKAPDCRTSGERFHIVYRMLGDQREAMARARSLCLEQTVELPEEQIPAAISSCGIVGRIEHCEPADEDGTSHRVEISYAVETVGAELSQLLNVMFGNSSIQPGIRVERLLPSKAIADLGGPRFGLRGLRALTGVGSGPLLCTALKPMGLSATELGALAEGFALGGIDIIKDDHGLSDQVFAPFERRLEACVAAVERASRTTGRRMLYAPNVTGDFVSMSTRARLASRAEAGALLEAPGLCGFSNVLALARDPQVNLPLLVHPALLGSFVASPQSGISHAALFGQIIRIAGGDATIFPSFGGRFAFTRAQCRAIAAAAREDFAAMPAIAPVPAGGMRVERLAELLEAYGADVVLLIGGALLGMGPDVAHSARELRREVDAAMARTR